MDSIPDQQQNEPNLSQPVSKLPAWMKIVFAVAGAVVVLTVAIVIGSKFYYQVTPLSPIATTMEPLPLTPTTTITQQLLPGETSFEEESLLFQKALASAKIESSDCSVPPYSYDSSDTDEFGKLCLILLQQGTTAIQYPLMATYNPSNAYGYGNEDSFSGVGIISIDTTEFLLHFDLFHLSSDTADQQYKIQLNRLVPLEDMSRVTSVVALSFPQTGYPDFRLVQVSGVDVTGNNVQRHFAQSVSKYGDGNFSIPVEKNIDGSFSIRLFGSYNPPAHVSLLVPFVMGASEVISDRDYEMERQYMISPLYHKSACGLEESYSDIAFWAPPATIAINFGYQPILHVTTATVGYAPEEWGKVLKDITMSDFLSVVQEPEAARSASLVEMLTIGGYTVKHTGPITPDRTCQYQQDQTYDMYQAIKNGAVVTVTIRKTPSDQNVISQDSVHRMIEQVLTSLTFSPR